MFYVETINSDRYVKPVLTDFLAPHIEEECVVSAGLSN
jgi:hypothetical protein